MVAPAVLGMVADVAAMKSRLNEFHRKRQQSMEEEEHARVQAMTCTDNMQDKQQFVFPNTQAEVENCVPTQDTPVILPPITELGFILLQRLHTS